MEFFFPKKNSVLGHLSSLPPSPPPLKNSNFIFLVVSPSLTLTFFHADFGKEFPSRTLWWDPSRNCPSPSSALCPLLYRTEHVSRGEKWQKCAEKRGGRGVASKRGKKEKRTRENRSGPLALTIVPLSPHLIIHNVLVKMLHVIRWGHKVPSIASSPYFVKLGNRQRQTSRQLTEFLGRWEVHTKNCPEYLYVIELDPPTLAFFFFEKNKGNPEKNKGFSLRGTPKILGKERKNAPPKSEENRKTQKARKSKNARFGGSG